jgi:hypothetical protein
MYIFAYSQQLNLLTAEFRDLTNSSITRHIFISCKLSLRTFFIMDVIPIYIVSWENYYFNVLY